jgi:predicted transcriptional regulator
MAKNRDKVDIIAALMQAANSGANKTNIMLRANLSYQLLEKYLGTAIRLSFIQQNNKIYVLTERGREFLNRYNLYLNEFVKVEKSVKKLIEERELLRLLCQDKATTKLVPIQYFHKKQ